MVKAESFLRTVCIHSDWGKWFSFRYAENNSAAFQIHQNKYVTLKDLLIKIGQIKSLGTRRLLGFLLKAENVTVGTTLRSSDHGENESNVDCGPFVVKKRRT